MEKLRIDKWLWNVRIFKSRSKASDACREGKVVINENKVKPSHFVYIGDVVHVKKEGYNLVFKVEKLIKMRVSAILAAPCYTNLTSKEELNKFKSWYIGKSSNEFREKGAGRPSKKESRIIRSFKDEQFWEWDE